MTYRYFPFLLSCLLWGSALKAADKPIMGVLADDKQVSRKSLLEWKAEGVNTVVVRLDESMKKEAWRALADDVERSGLSLYAWVEVGRNEAMADAHPEWMAAPGGHHDDWRRRFLRAPADEEGKVVKVWPWVPIGYEPAFEAHKKRLDMLLSDLPGKCAGYFLNDLQAGPSSCGCGNDQCRWALDYGSSATAPKTPGDDAAARLVAELCRRHPGKEVIPVWVTECEFIDLPNVAASTGLCGSVECAKNTCWPSYAKTLNPLLKATPGPIGVALWHGAFERDPGWAEVGVSLLQKPPRGDAKVPAERTLAVLQGWDRPDALKLLKTAPKPARAGCVVALTKIEQSWEPRLVRLPKDEKPQAKTPKVKTTSQ